MIGRICNNHSNRNNGRPEGTFWWFYDHPMTLILLIIMFVLIGLPLLGSPAVVALSTTMLGFAGFGYGGGP